MDEDESAEDEEHASPPQHLLALSVQHKAQGGLRDRQCEAQGEREGLEPQVLGSNHCC